MLKFIVASYLQDGCVVEGFVWEVDAGVPAVAAGGHPVLEQLGRPQHAHHQPEPRQAEGGELSPPRLPGYLILRHLHWTQISIVA